MFPQLVLGVCGILHFAVSFRNRLNQTEYVVLNVGSLYFENILLYDYVLVIRWLKRVVFVPGAASGNNVFTDQA